jgi:phospholipid/cholesterol/gamma-HCH transport system ATP-binding protein
MSDATAIPAIAMDKVTVPALRQPAWPVVAGVNWTVAAGEGWVLAGAQKSGKTDFLLTVAGLMCPLEGTCRILGQDTKLLAGSTWQRHLYLALVSAEGNLFNHLTLAENVALPLSYHKNLSLAAAVNECGELLARFELTALANRRPEAVSMDWRKRAALARAMVMEPAILLCDNPLAGLGYRHRQWWLEFFGRRHRGQPAANRPPLTWVATAEELTPWREVGDSRFAVLREQEFMVLGSWTELEQNRPAELADWLAGPQVNPLQSY